MSRQRARSATLPAYVICFALPVDSRHQYATPQNGRAERVRTKKQRAPLFRDALCNFCPADAVLAKLPFPSKQGWITVGALLTSNQGLSLNRAQPSLHGINHIGFGALARNPEHRRAKYIFPPWKVSQKVKELFAKCHAETLN
jgi:hypothetical protein